MRRLLNTKHLPKKKPTVKHESDIKTLEVLVAGKPTRYDIQKNNENVNVPHNIFRLRHQHAWDIETEMYYFRKPSGEHGRLARYVLSDEHKKYAIDSGIVKIGLFRKRKVENITGLWGVVS